jgi:apolipoprotein D and lipocalin family protein
MRPNLLIILALSLSLGLFPAHANVVSEPEAQPPLELPRLMGSWYVIARSPNAIERGHVASRDEYELIGDNKVAIRYHYREGFAEPQKQTTARATVDTESGNRDWRVWFYKVIPTRQRILEVAPDYSWVLIGYPGRDLAWIFARSADMDDALYRSLVIKLRDDHGVYTDKLKRVPQHPEQVNKLGFEVPKHP